MDDDDDLDPVLLGWIGLLAWLIVPFLTGRIANANFSTGSGVWVRPTTALVMLTWASYRPSNSVAKLALLYAIDLLLSIAFYGSLLALAILLIVAKFKLSAMHSLTWAALATGIIAGVARTAFGRCLRRDMGRGVHLSED